MKTYLCPQCGQNFDKKEEFFPFCCERCKLIDLGAWATEKYQVPAVEIDEEFSSEDIETDQN